MEKDIYCYISSRFLNISQLYQNPIDVVCYGAHLSRFSNGDFTEKETIDVQFPLFSVYRFPLCKSDIDDELRSCYDVK